MSVRTTINLTDPRHDRITVEEDGLALWSATSRAEVLIRLPGGDEGLTMLAHLYDRLGGHLVRSGYMSEGGAA